jgi:hypothetical protein
MYVEVEDASPERESPTASRVPRNSMLANAAPPPVETTRTLAWPPLTGVGTGGGVTKFELKLALTMALEQAFSPTSTRTSAAAFMPAF